MNYDLYNSYTKMISTVTQTVCTAQAQLWEAQQAFVAEALRAANVTNAFEHVKKSK
jgi:hypothetical protein